MTKHDIKDKNIIYIDWDTYRKLKEVYKNHSAIPHHERIKIIASTAEEVKKQIDD